jgi:sigma-54-dependent transcriptional activator
MKGVTKNINEVFKLIVESSFDGIYLTDGSANTIFLNKSYEKITGIDKKFLIGKNMKTLVKNGIFNESASLLAIKERKKITINQKLKSGKNIFVTSTPVFDENDNIIYVVTNVRDMQELEKLEKELLKARELTEKYKQEIEKIKRDIYNENFITNNIKMEKILHLIENSSKFDTSILLQGETGTGKTFLAKMIHELSNRNKNEFFEINCSSLPEGLVESELFGYEKGAFTGALSSGKKGVFELANNSTLFLDEISELSLETQAKLLKVLETGKFMRIGGEKFITTNIRLVSASNANIEELIQKGKFRKDLFYRINVINITIPPIRERKEDIFPLMMKFLKFYNQKYNLDKRISEEVYELLKTYNWPGNIREIRNLIEHLVVVSKEDEISVENLPNYIANEFIKKIEIDKMELLCTCCFQIYTRMGLKEATEQFQKDVINFLIEKGNSKSKVAKLLNVNPSTITRKFQK